MTKAEHTVNRAAWEQRVSEFRASGLSVPRWCASQGIKAHQLRYWLKKYGPPEEPAVNWHPVYFSDPEPALTVKVGPAAIEVRSGFDPQLLVVVVKTLSAL